MLVPAHIRMSDVAPVDQPPTRRRSHPHLVLTDGQVGEGKMTFRVGIDGLDGLDVKQPGLQNLARISISQVKAIFES
ncbi:MAG: hypothetical protein JWQ81_184 [Amycolatopsis sp.]|nr:hypothetical protein [Amycolatopsis sp.]